MPSHIVRLLSKVVRIYEIPVSDRTIEKTVLVHPDYPSMQCISDALDQWKVKYLILKLSLKKLQALNVPVIAHLNKGEFVWIERVSGNVRYWSAYDGWVSLTDETFEKEWSGVVLAIEDVTEAGEPDYAVKHRQEVCSGLFQVIFMTSLLGVGIFLTAAAWIRDTQIYLLYKILLFLINAMGVYICFTLIKKESHQSSRLTRKFCKQGVRIDCDKVVGSKYSKLFGFISWAELGAAWFMASFIWVSLGTWMNCWPSSFWYFVLIALPFTLWSLSIQAFVIRKWCLFCCAAMVLLWSDAVILLLSGYILPEWNLYSISAMVWLFLICTMVAYLVRKNIGKQARIYAAKRETAQLKYDFKNVHAQLSGSEYPMDDIGFVIGNTASPHEITLLVSMACEHCRKAIKNIRDIAALYPDYRYRIIMSASASMEEKAKDILKYFIRIYEKKDIHMLFDVLELWYSDKDFAGVEKKFPVTDIDKATDDVNRLADFCQKAKVSYAPAIFINRKLLSERYNYLDILPIVRSIGNENGYMNGR